MLVPLNFCRPFTASGNRIPVIHRALAVCQDTLRDLTNPFHVSTLSASALHEHQRLIGALQCPTKALKRLTR